MTERKKKEVARGTIWLNHTRQYGEVVLKVYQQKTHRPSLGNATQRFGHKGRHKSRILFMQDVRSPLMNTATDMWIRNGAIITARKVGVKEWVCWTWLVLQDQHKFLQKQEQSVVIIMIQLLQFHILALYHMRMKQEKQELECMQQKCNSIVMEPQLSARASLPTTKHCSGRFNIPTRDMHVKFVDELLECVSAAIYVLTSLFLFWLLAAAMCTA